MLVTGAAVPLKNRDGLGGPGNVIGFIGHAIFLDSAVKRGETLTIRNLAFDTRSKSHLCTIVAGFVPRTCLVWHTRSTGTLIRDTVP
jgi:hypothetical protein